MEFRIGSRAPDALLLADDEREVRLAELSYAGPVVLVFLRHFG